MMGGMLVALLALFLTALHVTLFLMNLKCAVNSFGSKESNVIAKSQLRQTIITDKKSIYPYALVTSEQNTEEKISNGTNIFSIGRKKSYTKNSPVNNQTQNGEGKGPHF